MKKILKPRRYMVFFLFLTLILCSACTQTATDEPSDNTAQAQGIVPEISGSMLDISETDIEAVDTVLQNWVAAQCTHDETALTEMNAEELRKSHEEGWVIAPTLTVTHCCIQRWGNVEQGVESDIYYTFETEDGSTLYGYEYVFLEKSDDAWQVTVNELATSETQFEGAEPPKEPEA